jgi:hypothetical protein
LLDDNNKRIKCSIRYEGENSEAGVDGNFYFDDVNLKNLEKAVGDSNNGLIKDVNSNTTAINKNTLDIAAIIDAIASQKILRGSGNSKTYGIYGSGLQNDTDSFTISFADTIPENAIILETTYIETVSGYVEQGSLSSITATR